MPYSDPHTTGKTIIAITGKAKFFYSPSLTFWIYGIRTTDELLKYMSHTEFAAKTTYSQSFDGNIIQIHKLQIK